MVAAAPAGDHSGASSAIGPMGGRDGVEVTPVELEAAPGVPAFAVDAPPALAVIVARLGAFGAVPDVVVSGINPGPNTGRSVLHSGTVGAALTAANMGLSGLAVSLGTGDPAWYETAAVVGAGALAWVAAAPPVRTTLGEAIDGRLQVELRETDDELDPDSDTALVLAGYVAVTPLVGIRAAADVELEAALAVEQALGFSPAAG